MTYTGVERRRFGRRNVFKAAIVTLADGRHVSCIVVDISKGGLRLQSSEAALVRGDIVIEVAADDVVYKGRPVHASGNSVGVQFTHAPKRISWGKTPKRRLADAPDE